MSHRRDLTPGGDVAIARVRFNARRFNNICRDRGLGTDAQRANALGFSKSAYSRIVNGRAALSGDFIGSVLRYAGAGWHFEDLFEDVPVDLDEPNGEAAA